MRRLPQYKRYLALCLTLMLLLSPALPARAASSLTASADKAAVTAGEQVAITLTLSGENLAIAQGSFTYDPALLTFAESDGGASDGLIAMTSAEKGGSDTLTAVIRMNATGAGEAKIDFALESVLDYSGAAQDTAGLTASVSVSVAAAPPEPAEPPVDYAEIGVKAENVQGATVMLYIWPSLENVTFPSKYVLGEIDYHGKTVPALSVPETNAPLLLYLSEANGDNGRFHIYEPEKDLLYPYRTVTSVLRSYILLTPDARVEVPAGFTETTLTIGETEIQAWSAEDAQGTVYLLYARNPEDEIGFYVYDPIDQSLQRYAVMPARPLQPTPLPAAAPTPAPAAEMPTPIDTAFTPVSGVNLTNLQFYILCGAAALLFLALIITWIVHGVEKSRRKKRAAQRRREREMARANVTDGMQ